MKFQLRMGDLLRLIFGLFVTLTIHICSAQGGVANRETLAAGSKPVQDSLNNLLLVKFC